ncbi:MAG TPA: hypothetical protein ENN81_08020, partial [Phycisphaerales bacterium]|nr:hypothetical protein [Phycisphaerales bacterium]
MTTLFAASLVAIWSAGWTPAANGAFAAAVHLIPIYLAAYPLRKVCGFLRNWVSSPLQSPAAVVLVLAVLASSTRAAEPQADGSPSGTLIAPYQGDPTLAATTSKVLVPYDRFIELWNQAHPEDRIDGISPGVDISLADVRYTIVVGQERLDLSLAADVRIFGRGPVVLNLPVADLAIVEAAFGGQPIQVHVGPKGNLVMLDGPHTGRLTVKALARPEWLGQRGSAAFSLPPLPGALMQIHLPDDSLVPEIEGLDGILASQTIDGRKTWAVGLGLTRRITLRWAPQAGGGAADQTLSAECTHDVYAFHWAMLGVTNIKYTFAAGQQDRFTILLPTDATLTALTGANLGDFSRVAERTVDGRRFDVIEVRLHRPARQTCELQLRWLADLPVFGRPAELELVRADGVSRESGTVTLHAVDGMAVRIADAQGARRMDLPAPGAAPAVAAEAGRPVACYYWPYRPFSLRLEMDRPAVEPQITLDQLIRINKDRAELLVQASLKAERGRIFGAAFELPSGYELLSVVGSAVEKYYERSADGRRIVHVKLREGCAETQLALVLSKRDIALDDFDVPKITYIDPQALSYPPQKGRLAVQVAASLDAGAITATGLKSITPRTLGDWLKGEQINSVQYAYRYEAPAPQLRLRIRRQPTRMSVETFAGVVVRPGAALYTYRLRHN